MGIQGTSNAAECMAILAGSRQNGKEKSTADNPAREDFTALLNRIVEKGGFIRETPTGDFFDTVKREVIIPKTTFTEHVRSPYDESAYWRQESEYSSFLDSFATAKAEYADDMWDTDSSGKRTLNKQGREHFAQWRMERLQSVTPDSIKDAEQRFEAGLEHLNNYMHTMFEDCGIECEFNYQPQAVPEAGRTMMTYWINKIGMSDYEGNAQRLRDFINGESGQDMQAMMEEVQFYGAISKLASTNSSFRDAYNEDQETALAKYAGSISAAMNTVELPKIQTAQNVYCQMLQPGF